MTKKISWIVLACVGVASGQKLVAIVDPVLNANAFAGTIPSNWSFQGTLLQGTSCDNYPFAVYRAMSPDGITEVKALPRLDWSWAKGFTYHPGPDCLPFAQEISARDFLRYMVGVLGVNFVKEAPVPELADIRQSNAQQNQSFAATAKGLPPMVVKGDAARFIVSYTVNGIPVEERLETTVSCMDSTLRMPPNFVHTYTCTALVYRLRTRQGNLDAAANLFKSIDIKIVPQWAQLFSARRFQEVAAQGQRNIQATKNLLAQSAAVLNRMHQDIMVQIQQGAESCPIQDDPETETDSNTR